MSIATGILVTLVLLGGAYAAWLVREKRRAWPLIVWVALALVATLTASLFRGDEPPYDVVLILAWLAVLATILPAAWRGEPVGVLGCAWRAFAGVASVIAVPITYFLVLGATACDSECDGAPLIGGIAAVFLLGSLLTLSGMVLEGAVRAVAWFRSP
ncbi:MAG: hypothetical protein JHC84_19485 [Solirubrobacteraceae bacterium]|nr:hypothetical protein [Solirubrobacteraceae bacterium]